MDRNLTDEDVKALVVALRTEEHPCRFASISEEDLRASVEFYKHFNQIMSESGSTVRKTLIVGVVGLLLTLLGLGVISKFKSSLGV